EHQKPDEAGHYHSANALQESLTMADKANKWFHDLNDQVMAGAALTYKGRAHIALAELHKAPSGVLTDRSRRDLKDATGELDEAYKSQQKGERRIGKAYALQAEGLLAEAQGDHKQAINHYQDSYCLYQAMSPEHRHRVEVTQSLKMLHAWPP